MRAGTTSPRIIATSALDHLYQIDTPADLQECLNAFLSAVKGSFRTLSKKDEDALIAIVTTGDKPISPELYQRYADNFRRAVDAVPIDDIDLSAQWHANVSRFAAYKAYHATEELRRIAEEEDGDMAFLRATLHKYNRYQAAEYNTAVARARTGKQWQQFDEPDNRRLFPCIKWLPSRSATPREEHMPFYNRVWPKDDPFWTYNQPGTLWNCKCDWEQTDEDPTDGNPDRRIVKPGLDQNPATSGQIFTDTAAYIKKAPRSTEPICRTICRDYSRQVADTLSKGVTCRIGEETHSVDFSNAKANKHFAQDCFKDDIYWVKNEVLLNPQPFLDEAELVGRKLSDTTHNTNRETKKLKAKTDYFYYYKITFSKGDELYLHLGRYKDTGNMYLYSASVKPPKNMEPLQ